MKWIFSVILCGLAATSSAQSIYKCRDAKGQPVYQSDPCPQAEKRWDTQPREYSWDDHYKRKAADQKIEQDRRHMRYRAHAATGRQSATGANIGIKNQSACESAKKARANAYEQMGVSRTFQASSYWDNYVWEACK